MSKLQNIIFPRIPTSAPEKLYFRLTAPARVDFNEGSLHLPPGSNARADTFYNGFSVGKWKETADLADLSLRLYGRGRAVVSVGLHRVGLPQLWIAQSEVNLDAQEPAVVSIPQWQEIGEGMLFFSMEAVTETVLTSGHFFTSTAFRNTVRLGISITHFKREREVSGAVERIRKELLEHDDFQGRVELLVVDNSQTLSLRSQGPVHVIPNQNYGGSGGFARGLLHFSDRQDFTHVLFMDDDASCEMESIARAYFLLSHARSSKTAVAGALILEENPDCLFEKGAKFDVLCRPLHSGTPITTIDGLLKAELEIDAPNYGAWWFFAFPIAETKAYPFPFFVRGDDILFGLMNKFSILTLNGVACYGEDFGSKHSPLTTYLDVRSHLLQLAYLKKLTGKNVLKVARLYFWNSLRSHLYSSAQAVTLALRHVSEGPDFFKANLDLASVRAEIAAFQPLEKMQSLERGKLGKVRTAPERREKGARKLIRRLTLNGLLIPSFLMHREAKVLLQQKSFFGKAAALFRYRQVIYVNRGLTTALSANHNKKIALMESIRFYKELLRILPLLEGLQRDYEKGFMEMTQKDYWKTIYAQSTTLPALQEEPLRLGKESTIKAMTSRKKISPPGETAELAMHSDNNFLR